MTTQFQETDAVSGVLTITLTADDYAAEMKRQLRHYAQRANVPGFRPGKLPASMAQKFFGAQAKMEAVNSQMSAALEGWLKESGRHVLAEPMMHEGSEPLDIEKGTDFTLQFDLGFAPQFDITLTADDKVPYRDITVSEQDVDDFFAQQAQRHGENKNVEAYEDGDMLRGILSEVLPADAEEGGILNEHATLMPRYFKNDAQKALFASCKPGDIVTFSPSQATEQNDVQMASMLGVKKEEVGAHQGDFTFQVSEISRYVAAPVDEALYKMVFPEMEECTADAARAKAREILTSQYASASDGRFARDLRDYCLTKAGELPLPDALLKRFMKERNKERENVEAWVEENYAGAAQQLRWQMITEKLVTQQNIHVEQQDVHAAAIAMARFQFAQYGMQNVPDEYLENYAQSMLKDEKQLQGLYEQAMEQKLIAALKNVVTLEHTSVEAKDF